MDELLPPLPPPETRFRRFLRLSIRWVVGFLIVFSLGVFVAVLAFFQPQRIENSRLKEELQNASQRIEDLETEVARLLPLEGEIEAIEEELKEANIYILILKSLSDVNAARLALTEGDTEKARQHLANTPDDLKELEQLVDDRQRGMVVAMQNRLQLALDEMENDLFASESDLRVLATNLEQLENSFTEQP